MSQRIGVQLIDAVGLLNERRSGRSDRSADFAALARWFAEAPDDAAAHQLWRAAFGLSPARHLSVTGDTADEWENVPTGTRVSSMIAAQNVCTCSRRL